MIEKEIGNRTIKLVDDYKNWKSWWSIRWTAVAAFFAASAATYPALPVELKSTLPHWVAQALAIAALLSSGLAGTSRVLSQTPKETDYQPEESRMDYIIQRLKEASTWQGIIAFIAGAAHFVVSPELSNSITTIAIFIVGAIWVGKKEAKSTDAPPAAAATTVSSVPADQTPGYTKP